MSTINNRFRTRSWLRVARFLAQAFGLAVTVAGSYSLIRGLGLPKAAFMGIVFLVGMFFCGWLCPFGTVLEWLRYIGKRFTGITLTIPRAIDRYLLLIRYIMPVLMFVLVLGAYEPRVAFISYFSGRVAVTAAYVLMAIFLVLSLFTDRLFCRYMCAQGAVHGLISMLRIFTIKRNSDACVNCGKCDDSCAMGVEISKSHNVRDPHCIDCFSCVSACPVPGALKLGFALPCRDDAKAIKTKYLG